ncbi:MAG: hypothetical protein ACTSY1_11195 [Alphaproteobacteria bacterium]
MTGVFGHLALVAAAFATMLAPATVSASAQQITSFARSGTYVIDGSTPVDARTRDLVDVYMEQRRNRELEEAERRNRVILFQYHGNTSFDQQLGRF